MSFSIYLVRHGQTLLNKFRRMQGWCDAPLTAKGQADGKMAGQHLANIKFDAAYHSDTMRAMNTCHLILAENNNATPTPKMIPELREQGFGYFEGQSFITTKDGKQMTYEQVLNQEKSLAKTRDFFSANDPKGASESNADFEKRIDAGLAILKANHSDGQNVLVVSHSLTIRSIVERIDPTLDVIENNTKNGSVTKLNVADDGTLSIAYYNHYQDDEQY